MKKNKTLLAIILVFVLLLGGAYVLYGKLSGDMASEQLAKKEENQSEAADEETQDQELTPAPDFTVYDAEGSKVNLTDYLGKPLVLNFWASWCGPCKSEMPEFNAKYLEHNGDITFLMVNMTDGGRETFEKAREYVEGEGFSFPVVYDKDIDAASTYGVRSLPTTYFIDEEGNLIAQANGAIDGETLQKGIDMIG